MKENCSSSKLTAEIKRIFRESRNNYDTRKIKKELDKLEWQVSRRRIGCIMKQEGLVSNYTVAQYKPHVDKCNESKIANVVNRQFKTTFKDEELSGTIEVEGKVATVTLLGDNWSDFADCSSYQYVKTSDFHTTIMMNINKKGDSETISKSPFLRLIIIRITSVPIIRTSSLSLIYHKYIVNTSNTHNTNSYNKCYFIRCRTRLLTKWFTVRCLIDF